MKKDNILVSKAVDLSVAELFETQAKNNPKALALINAKGKKYNYNEILIGNSLIKFDMYVKQHSRYDLYVHTFICTMTQLYFSP